MNPAPNLRVLSLHSVKGGTGKTVLSLQLAAHLARSHGPTCLVDADLTGCSLAQSEVFTVPAGDQCKSLADLLLSDPTCIPRVAGATLPSFDAGEGQRVSGVFATTDAYSPNARRQYRQRALLRFVYLEAESGYACERLVQLIGALSGGPAGVRNFVVDHSPGLHSLSRSFLAAVLGGGNGVGPSVSAVAILVASSDTPDRATTSAFLAHGHAQAADQAVPLVLDPRVKLVENRVPSPMAVQTWDLIDGIPVVPGVNLCQIAEEPPAGPGPPGLRRLLASGNSPLALQEDLPILQALYSFVGI